MSGAARDLDAVVLGHVDYGERDRIVRLLTPELGRIAVLARGARASRHRFAGALDLGNRIQAQVAPGREDLWALREATLVEGRLHAREDLVLLALATYGCELVGGLAQEERPERRLFGLLEVFLTVLDGLVEAPSSLFRMGLEIKALTLAGIAPVLDRCARCGGGLETGAVFSASAGGAVHVECGTGEVVTPEFLAALESARRTRLMELVDRRPPPGPAWCLASFAEHHLCRGLRSRAWVVSVGGA
ncbi:MAG: DNA repair protein RecO [Deltaproteobacteria bacterium]|nr:DNA repair protein RecO [Deltaproteobacteria bacterium]